MNYVSAIESENYGFNNELAHMQRVNESKACQYLEEGAEQRYERDFFVRRASPKTPENSSETSSSSLSSRETREVILCLVSTRMGMETRQRVSSSAATSSNRGALLVLMRSLRSSIAQGNLDRECVGRSVSINMTEQGPTIVVHDVAKYEVNRKGWMKFRGVQKTEKRGNKEE